MLGGGGLAYGIELAGCVTVVEQGAVDLLVVVIELVEQVVPLGIVVAQATHIGEGQAVLLIGCRSILFGNIDLAVLVVAEDRIVLLVPFAVAQIHGGVAVVQPFLDLVGGLARLIGRGARLGGVPSLARKDGHVIANGRVGHVGVGIVELVGCGDVSSIGVFFGLGWGSSGSAVVVELGLRVLLGLSDIAFLTVVPDGFRDVRGFGFDHVMAVGTQRNGVVAVLQNVRSGGAVAVVMGVAVGGHVFLGEGQFHGVGLARLDFSGLAEGDEVGGRLFDLVVDVELGIWSRVVQLYDVLARHVAGVGHFDGDLDGVAGIVVLHNLLVVGGV